MASKVIGDYNPSARDVVNNFNGNYLVYVSWDKHRMINSAMGFPLPPQMPFKALLSDVLPMCFKDHPEFEYYTARKLDIENSAADRTLIGDFFEVQEGKNLGGTEGKLCQTKKVYK